ncbi:hypothetical protein FL857_00605 [Criibacterium bergeronii]|uniref:DUF2802 domain-containing protein n=1 Tax=Criibacterium bergeronii TaxID=1871336 RepID=A0A552VDY0_9FIRM|nr:hypothetical protein [Criibacterium bergeronii]TRW28619.1 hypothetical protein FL857_00605 [Criibacterium bergeronii]
MSSYIIFGIAIVSLISLFLVVFIFYKINFKNNSQDITQEVRIDAQLMLFEKKLQELEEKVELLTQVVNSIDVSSNCGPVDEISLYTNNGMSVQEMAKKMNKSVKEVELLLKMRGK